MVINSLQPWCMPRYDIMLLWFILLVLWEFSLNSVCTKIDVDRFSVSYILFSWIMTVNKPCILFLLDLDQIWSDSYKRFFPTSVLFQDVDIVYYKDPLVRHLQSYDPEFCVVLTWICNLPRNTSKRILPFSTLMYSSNTTAQTQFDMLLIVQIVDSTMSGLTRDRNICLRRCCIIQT